MESIKARADLAVDKLMMDLKVLVGDAEALLNETAAITTEKVATIRTQAEASLRRTKLRIEELQPYLVSRVRETAHIGNEFVRTKPWAAAGIAVGVGAIVGLLVGRR